MVAADCGGHCSSAADRLCRPSSFTDGAGKPQRHVRRISVGCTERNRFIGTERDRF
jgi:hypothetical protein